MIDHASMIRDAIACKVSSEEKFCDRYAAYDLALCSGNLTQKELAKRWGWSQSKVSRKREILVMAAHGILADLHKSEYSQEERAYSIGQNGTKNAVFEKDLHNSDRDVHKSEYFHHEQEKEKEKKEKVTQKEKKEREKEPLPHKEKPPFGGQKEKSPSPRHYEEEKQESSSPNGKKQKPLKRFKKPNFDDVSRYFSDYAAAKDLRLSPKDQAEAFIDHYDSNGWKVGGRTGMKDWKAAVRNWCRSDFRKGIEKKQNGYKFREFKGVYPGSARVS